MINKDKIERINFLARKKKAEGLTTEELEEQQSLRAEYLEAVRANLKSQLDSIEIMSPDYEESYTEEDMEACTLAFYGAQKEIFIRYYERELPFKSKKLVKSIVYHMFRLLDISSDTLKNTMKDGFVFLDAYRDRLPQIL